MLFPQDGLQIRHESHCEANSWSLSCETWRNKKHQIFFGDFSLLATQNAGVDFFCGCLCVKSSTFGEKGCLWWGVGPKILFKKESYCSSMPDPTSWNVWFNRGIIYTQRYVRVPKEVIQMSHKKRPSGCLWYIWDEILPSYVGIISWTIIIYKDPY